MNRYVCIHCHFYQPPRENPWLEEVELQDSAYPYHDWNKKITAECYAPNAASRILDAERRIIDIVNSYEKISFNFGPTLLWWLQSHEPEVYQAILEADRESQKRFSGHGSAIAQPYNHMIMPLAHSRDKRTQIIWGIKDFEHRFGRKPEGMWLPETAVDTETLEVMAEQGIQFTILAPKQARRWRKIGEKTWIDVSQKGINPRMPYRYRLPSGKAMNLFFYDGPISHDIAFNDLLTNGEAFAKRLLGAFPSEQEIPQIVHIATDGETYGHHHRFGDMALAYCLYFIEANNLAQLTIYAEHLEKHPPTHEAEIIENSSWSCVHGVERWRGNCGCSTGMNHGWTQEWRAPLRGAMDWLRDTLIHVYEEDMAHYLKEPWQARDDYIEVILDRSPEKVQGFFAKHAVRELSEEDKIKALKLLEMQRNAMLMYTSCGWFFDDISGIETVQVMQFAACAMQLAREVSGIALEEAYIKILERAPSNLPKLKNGAQVYDSLVRPAIIDLLKVGVHYALSSLFEEYPDTVDIYCYTVNRQVFDKVEAGKQKLAVGRACVRSHITGEERCFTFGVLHFGDHNLNGGARKFLEEESFAVLDQEMKDAFRRSDIPEVIRLMDKHFGMHNYSLWNLFKDEQRKVLNLILETSLKEIEASFQQIYGQYYPFMQVMNSMRIPFPKAFAILGERIFNAELRQLLEREELDLDKLQKTIDEVKRWPFELDKASLGFMACRRIDALMESLSKRPEDISLLETIEAIIRILGPLSLQINFWKTQNIYFSIGKQLYGTMQKKVKKGEEAGGKWVEHFKNLGNYLQVKSP